jgi:hypothetical protein
MLRKIPRMDYLEKNTNTHTYIRYIENTNCLVAYSKN